MIKPRLHFPLIHAWDIGFGYEQPMVKVIRWRLVDEESGPYWGLGTQPQADDCEYRVVTMNVN